MNHEHEKYLNMKERDIIDLATHNFHEITGARFSIKSLEGRNSNADAVAKLEFEDQQQDFYLEVKDEVRSFQLPKLIHHFNYYNDLSWILLAQYIPSTIKAELKEKQINYLEASGNCYIKNAGLYFFINDKKVTDMRLPKGGKLWNATGLKFLFVLLTDPKLINASYRDIAKSAGIALGNVGSLLEELKDEGFLKNGDSPASLNFLDNLPLLTDRWAALYTTVLKPKIRIGKFRRMHPNEDWSRHDNSNYVWGGENAGAILTNYLNPEFFTMYTNQPKSVLMKEEKLIPDPQGNVELVTQFWSDELQQDQAFAGVIPPLMAYAELSTDRDSRNQETAERIKNQYLNEYV